MESEGYTTASADGPNAVAVAVRLTAPPETCAETLLLGGRECARDSAAVDGYGNRFRCCRVCPG